MPLIDVTGAIPVAKNSFAGFVTVYRWYPMSDVTFLQRIANVLHRARVDGGWDDEEVARKVLEEMREPTKGMVEYLTAAGGQEPFEGESEEQQARRIYSRLIDNILAEVPNHTSSEIGHG